MSGKMLVDHELVEAIRTKTIGLTNFDLDSIDITSSSCPIQASSLDLSVGEIYFPTPKKLDEEHALRGETGYRLAAGDSIVIETLEELSLKANISGICFPPARLARDGLMMTNPGHIDPGFSGKLTFTLINFGREECSLRKGDPISTFLFFDLGSGAQVPYNERLPKKEPKTGKIPRILNKLSPDFANFSERAENAAKLAVARAALMFELKKIYLPFVLGVATIVITQYFTSPSMVSNEELEVLLEKLDANFQSKLSQEISDTTSRLVQIERELARHGASADLTEIRERLNSIEQSIQAVE